MIRLTVARLNTNGPFLYIIEGPNLENAIRTINPCTAAEVLSDLGVPDALRLVAYARGRGSVEIRIPPAVS